ncbi:MAG: stage IV sporulation protein A [Lachnospiraceae bacterium]|nr:stage IV sporulation protein A [Lachnospiraceae bacterium]
MDRKSTNTYDLYHDIQERCGGEIYIGVLGPVRTGKSTFITRFMEEMVLPNMTDENAKSRARDELPLSGVGKTITTMEPKFVPNEAAKIHLQDGLEASVRLIDCVGYLVSGATGHMEEEKERLVHTPWFEKEIPFSKAAEIGTDKVMNEHSTVGLVITTDGTIGDISRENYLEAEAKTILALQQLHKPFIVLLNSTKPYSEETQNLAKELEERYKVKVMPVNCKQLQQKEINEIMEELLYEFPIDQVHFHVPSWIELLPADHEIKQELLEKLWGIMEQHETVRDAMSSTFLVDSAHVNSCKLEEIQLSKGSIKVCLDFDDAYYYGIISQMVGEEIRDEGELLHKLKTLAEVKQAYMVVADAIERVHMSGYGVVVPGKDEIHLEQPELIKHGNKYGVKIKASAPSIHLIKANIETEIAPIVGTQEQAEDLISFINQADRENAIWNTNIFGKTVEQLVNDGINAKMGAIGEDSQMKLQDTMQKIVNDSNGGMVCIII